MSSEGLRILQAELNGLSPGSVALITQQDVRRTIHASVAGCWCWMKQVSRCGWMIRLGKGLGSRMHSTTWHI